MLYFIDNLPPHVVGIHAVGDVNQDDYKNVLVPKLDELAKRQGELNYLLVLDTDVQNFSAGAWFEDVKLGLKHFTQWNKIAVVTDQKGVEWFTDMFRLLIPGKAKGFPREQLEEAKKWIAEKLPESNSKTAAPPSDNDAMAPDLENSSNKGQGPAGENL